MSVDIEELARRFEVAITKLEYYNNKTQENARDIAEIKKDLIPVVRFVSDCSRGRKFLAWLIATLGVVATIGLNLWNTFYK